MPYIQSTLSSKYQIVVPAAVRRALHLSSGDSLLWRITTIDDKPRAVAESMPKNRAEALRGLGKKLWQNVSISEYIKELREEWQHD